MVYKAVSGVNENAYDIYNSDYTHNEKKRAALDVTNQYFADYKNRIVLNWDDFNPAEVLRLYLMPDFEALCLILWHSLLIL